MILWGSGGGGGKIKKQVAQRATIAHLSPMCQGQISFKKTYKWAMETRGPNSTELLCLSWLPATLINKPASKVIKNLNSFQIREQLFFQNSNVSRLNMPEIKPLVVFKHVLVTKEQASMETSLSHYNSLEYFSNTQGPLIPQ